MAQHRAFWVILAGAVPTAFRSPRRDDLVPTLVQLQRTQPDVQLKWFDGVRTWESPEQAEAAFLERRRQRRERGADWRPGGSHQDPRARYQLSRDEKRARFKKRQRRPPAPRPPFDKPGSSRPPARKPANSRPAFGKPPGSRPPRKPTGARSPHARHPARGPRKPKPPR